MRDLTLPTIRFNYRTARAFAALHGFELRKPDKHEGAEAALRWGSQKPYMCLFVEGKLDNAWQRVAWESLLSTQDWHMFTRALSIRGRLA